MKRMPYLLAAGVAIGAIGLVADRSLGAAQEQETNYVVIQEFELASDLPLNASVAKLSGWVRTFRASGKHSSVRLFMHEWGTKASLYVISETTDWSALGTMFADLLESQPDFMTVPFGFSGHSDNILTEIPVE